MVLSILKPIFVLFYFTYLYQCATIEQAKSNPFQAYVLTGPDGQVIDNSGVRLGPLDLSFETLKSLRKYNLPQELIQKLEPYMGKRGQEALTFVQQRPFRATAEEYNQIVKGASNYWMKKLQKVPPFLKDLPEVKIKEK